MSQQSIARYGNEGYLSYLAQIRQYPILTEKEEERLARAVYDRQDVKSVEKLVTSHLRLVAKLAFTMRGYGMAIMDLIGEGCIGLMQAVKKFNPYLGVRFSAYAKWWIKAHIQEYIMRSWSLVKMGTTVGQKRLFFHLRKAKEKILSIHNTLYLTNEDCRTIARELSVTSKEVKEMDLRFNTDISIDTANNEEGETIGLDILADQEEGTETKVAETQEKSKRLNMLERAIELLDDRQADIIRNRHFKEKAVSLQELGKKYGISTERVRQVEKDTLQKIKEFCLRSV